MDQLLIRGGRTLQGEVTISGAKNAALPILCAGLLTAGDVELSNVPHLHDVKTMLKLLATTGLANNAYDAFAPAADDYVAAINRARAPLKVVA